MNPRAVHGQGHTERKKKSIFFTFFLYYIFLQSEKLYSHFATFIFVIIGLFWATGFNAND
jgi:hypothetical protein